MASEGEEFELENGEDTSVVEEVREPPLFRVLLLNDDYTPMDFVIAVLEKLFGKPPVEANRIMLEVHHHGRGEAGVYTFEIAEAKVEQVHAAARRQGHPLRATLEPA